MKRIVFILSLWGCLVPCSDAEAKTIQHFSGSYTGKVVNDLPHNRGTFTSRGSKYIGEWKAGKPWEGTEYNKDRNVIATYSEGVKKPVN